MKNSFDKILTFKFWFKTSKNDQKVSDMSQFWEGLSKGLIINHILWEKNWEDKNLLMTLKKHSYIKICGIVKV
jgi:hypothetical protein